MPKPNRAEIEAQIAALQAELAASNGGVYQDPATGRWFVVLRSPGRRRTTTRRRALDGSRLLTGGRALVAKGQWETQLAAGSVPIGRERFETYWPRFCATRRRDDPGILGVLSGAAGALVPFASAGELREERTWEVPILYVPSLAWIERQS